MSSRRMVPFILVNILVSAATVIAILYWWDSRQPETEAVETAPQIVATSAAVAEQSATVSAAENEPTAEADDGPPTYTVKQGDTLGTISVEFDVPLEDIMEANGLSDPNVISVGQELIIPIGGIPEPTPAPTATSETAVLPSPIPTQALEVGEVNVEISGVTGAGELSQEAVTITNLGDRPVGLSGWKIRTEGGTEYTFGLFTLFGDGSAVILHTESGVDSLGELYWGQTESLWQPGETVTLLDAEGSVQATFVVPAPEE
ncbi:MAG: LysM peptidoglycan-binding domain-containing protein [Anaerolineales bacterium]|nr:LysM peptidoglycan-binding domain-containing protein [Anaerolineales bacterium]